MIIVLAIDVGSSSIRCSAYQVDPREKFTYRPPRIKLINDCCAVRKGSAVQPKTGRIILQRSNLNTSESSSTDATNEEVSLFDEIDSCISETLRKLRMTLKTKPFRVHGIGITTFAMNMIGVKVDGSLCGEYYTMSYACNDGNVRKQCEVLKTELGESRLEEMYQRTGAPLHNAFALAQLREIYDPSGGAQCHNVQIDNISSEKSDFLEGKSNADIAVAKWLTISSICIARWSGTDLMSMPISYSEASWTGMFQFRSCKWDDEYISLLPENCMAALPNVQSFYDGDFRINSNDVTKDWGELIGSVTSEGCRAFLGFGDGACANVGSKCTSPDRIAVTIGTSAATRVCLPLPITDQNPRKKQKISKSLPQESNCPCESRIPAGLFCYRFDDATVLLGGALTDGGSIIEWLRELLNLSSDEEFLKCHNAASVSYEASNSASSKNKLTIAPFLSGERSTGYRGGASGCVMGFTRETRSSDLLRGAMESVILRINAILSLIKVGSDDVAETSYASNKCILASGNGLEKNNLWRQMLADCSGFPVVLDGDTKEGTSRGAALLVAKAIQFKNRDGPMNETLNIQNKLIPDEDMRSYWDSNKIDQEHLITQIEPLWTVNRTNNSIAKI